MSEQLLKYEKDYWRELKNTKPLLTNEKQREDF